MNGRRRVLDTQCQNKRLQENLVLISDKVANLHGLAQPRRPVHAHGTEKKILPHKFRPKCTIKTTATTITTMWHTFIFIPLQNSYSRHESTFLCKYLIYVIAIVCVSTCVCLCSSMCAVRIFRLCSFYLSLGKSEILIKIDMFMCRRDVYVCVSVFVFPV